ncbi:MAG: IMP dehydrogenase, partial [Calditrichaeota bacterium]|nr:IMP dehydrogenase [Calditrichota bacterium]
MTEKNLITDSSLNDKNGSDKVSGFGLTFDDVLIEPRRSAVLPHQVSLRTKVTRKISLNIPFLSAAMDTVTESRLAIAIAREGGIGVIHKNLTIANQAAEVKKVKRSESFIIAEPVTLPYDKPLSYAIEIMLKHGISGIPIMDGDVLCGILTHRDIRFADDTTRLISSYMTKMPLITTPVGTTVEDAKAIFIKHHIEKLPVVDEKGHILGLITAKDIEKKLDFPNACMDDHGRLRVGAAVGIAANTMERVRGLVEEEIDLITVDTAHGHSEGVLKTVERIKNEFPDVQILAGNVATADGARDLVTAGADGIKIGIGAGAICTTRVIAGIGVPQITAVMSGYQALKDSGVPIVADGGIRYSGDAAKALAAGADTVMLGNLLAGVDESPGETIL